MTDDALASEIEEVARLFSKYPSGLAELRALIASLPAPSPLVLPGVSETGLPTTEEQTAELASGPIGTGAAGPTAAVPPGTISGGSIAPGTLQANAFASSIRPIQMIDGPDVPTLPDVNFPEGAVIFNLADRRLYENDGGQWHTLAPDTGLSNLLADPAFSQINYGAYIGTSNTRMGQDWYAKTTYDVGGPAPSGAYLEQLQYRTDDENPFASSIIEFTSPGGVGTWSEHTDLWPWGTSPSWQTDLPFVVAAMQVIDWGGGNVNNWSTLEVTLEIVSSRAGETVEAYQTVDVKTLPPDLPVQLWTACARDPSGSYSYWLRLKFHTVKALTSWDFWQIGLGEPQLHFASTPDPAMYTPAIAHWLPDQFSAYDQRGSRHTVYIDRYGMLLYAYGDAGAWSRLMLSPAGEVKWSGTTSNHDTRLSRESAGVLVLDANGAAVDADLRLKGAASHNARLSLVANAESDARLYLGANDGLRFGPGSATHDVALQRSGTKTLTIDDVASGPVTLKVVGVRQAPPSSSQTLAADTALLANAELVMFTCSGAVTTTAAPTIADGLDGQMLTVLNVGTGTWTIKDQGTLASSNLRLTASTVAIGPRQSIQLVYSSTIGDWVQIGALTTVI